MRQLLAFLDNCLASFFLWAYPATATEKPEAALPLVSEPLPEAQDTTLERREAGLVLYDYAFSCLGEDMSPKENELGCAESLYYILKGAGMRVPKQPVYSTAVFDAWMSENYERVEAPEVGDIISSPTGKNRGHVGVVGIHKIMSNNSSTFKWDDHWYRGSWISYYGSTLGLPVNYYRAQ